MEMLMETKVTTCAVEGCERAKEARGWCMTHYYRWRRTGQPGSAAIKTKRPGLACSISDCHTPADALGYCIKHYTRVYRHGDPTIKLPSWNTGERNGSWKGDGASYGAVHSRLTRLFGSASDHSCVDCGLQAQDWSYDHSADVEYRSDSGPSKGCAYTTDLDAYSPRCRACHHRFDHGQ